MKNIYVEKCCECPFVCCVGEDFGEYDCEFKPKGIDKEGTYEDGRKYIIAEDIPSGTEKPPDWCPLRKEEVITVQLTMKWALEEVDGKS
ncbi:MAG: hypothetical protein ACTSW7_00950 [Candidatus Thorarchaeota archaeon]|nr:MAG: hypothetical protein DRQ25_04770 [Candidatus Fermentibacteria bacterium]HEC72056.1 hypothetical protein [Thermoplasmatales archaeon]